MPSRLRQNIVLEQQEAVTAIRSSASPPPSKKQKMSLSQTYYIASSARAKLGKEACRPDHNLRLLVGHANLLDSLMVELRDAEREQEAWFNASVKGAQEDEPKHIRWVDTIVEEEDDDSDSDSDSDFDEEDFEIAVPRRIISAPVTITSREIEEDEEELGYEDFEDSPELALTRTSSHPPELIDDSDSEDDMSPPTTPPQAVLEFSEKTMLEINMSKKHSVSYQHLMPHSTAPLIESY